MTKTDLKNNRKRIIKEINLYQADIKSVMLLMVNRLDLDKKPLMKNIDKLVKECCDYYFKHVYKPTAEQCEATMEQSHKNQINQLY